jgi:hypothetical protein
MPNPFRNTFRCDGPLVIPAQSGNDGVMLKNRETKKFLNR